MTDTIRDAAEALLAAMDGATEDFAAERAALRAALDFQPRLNWSVRVDFKRRRFPETFSIAQQTMTEAEATVARQLREWFPRSEVKSIRFCAVP
jgi:hypothetical protein